MEPTQFHKVLILPDAGPENPFQYQLIDFLKSHGIEVNAGQKRSLAGIYKAVKAFDPDIVYFDWVHSFIIGRNLVWSCIKSFVFILEIFYLHALRKTIIVHTLHNLQNHNQVQLALERRVYGFFLRRCSKVRVYSEAVKQAAVHTFHLSPDRFYIIQDIPYHHYYPNQANQEHSRAQLNLAETDFVFLFFGRIRAYKGLENLIRSFLLTAQPNDRLLIAGESQDPHDGLKLRNLSAQNPEIIWFDRFITSHEVQYFFNAADVVILPFTNIDHSGTIDLAMSFSKPVITLKTEATTALLAHQADLLFEKSTDLPDCLIRSHQINLEKAGDYNFKIADAANYRDLISLFQKH